MTLVVLHGGNSAAAEMRPLTERLGHLAYMAPNMIGHGGRALPPRLTLEAIGEDLLAQCDAARIGMADWFGYSIGGAVALWLAANRPERVRSLALLSTKHVYDARTVAHMTHLADLARLRGRSRAADLAALHAPQDWERIAMLNRDLFASFGPSPPAGDDQLRAMTMPVLVMGALGDPIVPIAETRHLASLLPNASLTLFPGTAHPLTTLPLDVLVARLTEFVADPDRAVRRERVDLLRWRWDRDGSRSF